MKCLILILILIVSGCGGATGVYKKPLSAWTSNSVIMDLDKTTMGTSRATFIEANGSQCACGTSFVGSQNSGTYSFYSCTYVLGTGVGDPGCSTFNSTGTYSYKNNHMSMCGATCAEYD